MTQRYDFIQSLGTQFAVTIVCELLKVSRTAYYRYLPGASYQLTPFKEKQLAMVKETFWDHKRRYGSRRLPVELQQQGNAMGRYRVRSLMKQQGLVAIQPKSFVPRTTDSRHGKRICPNLLLDQPMPMAPNLVWVSDITYLPLVDGQWA